MFTTVKVSALALLSAVTASSNTPPTAYEDHYTMYCNSGAGINVTANDVDPDGDPLTVTSVSGSAALSWTIGSGSDGIVVVATNTPNTGTHWGYYEVSDGQGGTGHGQIIVNVIPGGPYCSY